MTHSTSRGTRLSLLARARQRDAAAWREIVELYAPLVAHWTRRCGLDSHEVADCIQDVFSSVASAIDSYTPRHTSGAVRGWLWTITRNKVRDLIRRKTREPRAVGGSTARQQLADIPD